ncbi:hypothetical protein Mp_8g00910 [Marchantia polymorpha subsp. ruderalis]|uniref:Uncharacterized protein n=1 Tax=Marchantia polymorpha TaxID=3197 RepID=A0A2R6WRF5_MARPO|nr:hypothetical protein MARPO_0064s0106 [Marchantia polymorpha]BBN18241.1 hypothetical protein Mp_8g00910 [Marchantia polymorpha subsp. ruderalis]|eukprot:PTQ36432.1 hypothetical protein MARPO_0064s0106 [Marchantia polymorpha]
MKLKGNGENEGDEDEGHCKGGTNAQNGCSSPDPLKTRQPARPPSRPPAGPTGFLPPWPRLPSRGLDDWRLTVRPHLRSVLPLREQREEEKEERRRRSSNALHPRRGPLRVTLRLFLAARQGSQV